MQLPSFLCTLDSLHYIQALIMLLTFGGAITLIVLGVLWDIIGVTINYAVLMMGIGVLAVNCCAKQRIINRLRGLGLHNEIIV
jgi:hypothetical protein